VRHPLPGEIDMNSQAYGFSRWNIMHSSFEKSTMDELCNISKRLKDLMIVLNCDKGLWINDIANSQMVLIDL